MSKKQSAPAMPEVVVYCGPAIRGIAAQYTAFTDGLPDAVQQQCEKTPALRTFLVPPEKLSQMRTVLNDPNSAESMIYAQVLTEMKGVK